MLYTIHVVVCFFLILVVLLQQGKGADLSVFGGGSHPVRLWRPRGSDAFCTRLTVAGFIAFIFTTVGIGFLQSSGRQRLGDERRVEEEAPRDSEPAEGELEAVPEPETTGGGRGPGRIEAAQTVAEPTDDEETDEPRRRRSGD